MDKQKILEQREQLMKEMEQHKANLHACSGAIQILDKVLAWCDTESVEVVNDVKG